jgi:hypothetical protein
MNTARSFAVIALVGFVTLSRTHVSFGQDVPVPAAPALSQGPQPAVAAADQPAAAAAVQPLPAIQPLPVQPDPAAAALQPPAAAPVQPVPAAAGQPVPVAGVPTLALTRGSHLIGSPAILVNGVRIGNVQDLLSVAGSGEYVLVANPSGFVTIPRSLTTFEPGRGIMLVNMTFAQVGELPRLLRLAQLNRQFLGRVHTFFGSPRGQALFRNNLVSNTRQTRPPGGIERRAETRTAGKPAIRPQTREESHPQDDHDRRR